MEFSRSTSGIVVMFDALDECEKQHFGQIIDLIQNLNDSGIRVYATAREHRETIIYRQLKPQQLEIKANVEDVKKYLTQELERRKVDVPEDDFRKEIVNEIADGVQGM